MLQARPMDKAGPLFFAFYDRSALIGSRRDAVRAG